MKRKLSLILLAFGLAALIPAQGIRPSQPAPRQPQGNSGAQPRREVPKPETVTVSGSLIVMNGSPAVRSGEDTYIVSGIRRLLGLVDGLKEGAQITLEGVAITVPRDEKVKVLMTSKLTLGGKTYDLPKPGLPAGFMRQWNQPPSTRQFNQPQRMKMPHWQNPQNRPHRQDMHRKNPHGRNQAWQKNRQNQDRTGR